MADHRLSTADREELATALGSAVRFDEPMSRHTSFRIGGPADAWVEATSVDQLVAAMRVVHSRQLTAICVGGGTNVLVSDCGVRGVVIRLGRPFGEISWEGESPVAGASVPFKKLVLAAIERDLQGLEFAEGHSRFGWRRTFDECRRLWRRDGARCLLRRWCVGCCGARSTVSGAVEVLLSASGPAGGFPGHARGLHATFRRRIGYSGPTDGGEAKARGESAPRLSNAGSIFKNPKVVSLAA